MAGEGLDLAEPLAQRGRGARGPGVAEQLEDRVEERFGRRQVNQAHFFTPGNLGELSRASDGRVEPAEFIHQAEFPGAFARPHAPLTDLVHRLHVHVTAFGHAAQEILIDVSHRFFD